MTNKKRPERRFTGTAAMVILALALIFGRPAPAAADAWPKHMKGPKGEVVLYQPQLESFAGDKLTARAAVSVKTKEMKAPAFGVVWIAARVATDRDTRMATVTEARITDAKFVGAKPEQLERLKAFLDQEMAGRDYNLSLDRLLAMLELVQKERAGAAGLNNAPPKIIFVSHPAVLVLLEGPPQLRPLEKSPLMRVVNTPFLMLYDPAAKFYFLKGDGWLTAADLKGPWQELKETPEALKALEVRLEKEKDLQPPKKAAPGVDKKPEIIVSTEPAELIAAAGEPNYTPISGTNLLFLSNTESTVFMDTGSQEYYVLLSGRWFRAKSLTDGPWTFVAPDHLPGDFAKIPPGSPKGYVRTAVAGTDEATDAVRETYIPQTAAIDRKKATTQVKYDGEPKFEKIPNTDLEYAVNTGKAVFKSGATYYVCDQGVWYQADAAGGPWKVAVDVPKQVNDIPPGNPHYNVKYVKVYDATADVAYVGYTPGYTGSYAEDGTVVYGTGCSYPAYASQTAYVPYPATYGFAATYNPYSGYWGYQPSYDPYAWMAAGLIGLGAGIAIGAAVSHPWYGPYWGGGWWGPGGYNNININNIHNNVINPNWRPGPPGPPGPGPKPGPGPGPRPNIYNRPENQQKLASRAQKPPAGAPTGSPGAKAAKPRPPQAQTAKANRNNVYAGKNGNVYRHTNQGWQQRQGDNWAKPAAKPSPRPSQPVDMTKRREPGTAPPRETPRPSAAATPRYDPAPLNREWEARQRGDMRTQNFERAQGFPSHHDFGAPAFHGSGGGVSRGGGRRR
jgi:hypothetical protein